MIAARLRPQGSTLDQTMVALLRANPGAFINDNINLVRQGAVLRLPDSDALEQASASEARAIVREQVSQWRQMRQPSPQADAVASEERATDSSASTSASAGTGGAPRVADARLEITPPSDGSGQGAGTRSGIAAGGEGDMLRQQMQQTQETLAARNAEVEELKARVAELEQLQQQQQQLISLKDSELAAAQQRLANSNQQVADSGAATTAEAAGSVASGDGGGWVWPVLGLALIAAGIVAWLLLRRRPATVRGRRFDTSTLAAGMPGSKAPDPDAAMDEDAGIALDAGTAVDAAGDDADDAVSTSPSTSASWNPPPPGSVEMAAPTWHSGTRPAEPVVEAGSSDEAGQHSLADAPPGGHERIELARAYIDLGDADTAKSLLQEVIDGSDVDAREEARRLLREMA
jgi:pilus assembly protein FimV